jgi:uncharacterized protein YjiS (DUF1127 family)
MAAKRRGLALQSGADRTDERLEIMTMNTQFASRHMDTSDAGIIDRIGALLAGLTRFIADLPRRRGVLDELHMLSEHELNDIGLTRGDIGHVFDADFIAQRDAERFTARAPASHRTAL